MVNYLRFRELQARGIISNWPTLKNRIEKHGFPAGQKLGPNTRVWREDDVQAWLDSRTREFSQSLRGAALERKRAKAPVKPTKPPKPSSGAQPGSVAR